MNPHRTVKAELHSGAFWANKDATAAESGSCAASVRGIAEASFLGSSFTSRHRLAKACVVGLRTAAPR